MASELEVEVMATDGGAERHLPCLVVPATTKVLVVPSEAGPTLGRRQPPFGKRFFSSSCQSQGGMYSNGAVTMVLFEMIFSSIDQFKLKDLALVYKFE